GMPPFSSFLSEARFQLRCRMAKDQLQRFLKHPLFFECGEASLPSKIRSVKEGATKWRDEQTIPEEKRNRGEEISPIELSRTGPIWTFTGSSFGPVRVVLTLSLLHSHTNRQMISGLKHSL